MSKHMHITYPSFEIGNNLLSEFFMVLLVFDGWVTLYTLSKVRIYRPATLVFFIQSIAFFINFRIWHQIAVGLLIWCSSWCFGSTFLLFEAFFWLHLFTDHFIADGFGRLLVEWPFILLLLMSQYHLIINDRIIFIILILIVTIALRKLACVVDWGF